MKAPNLMPSILIRRFVDEKREWIMKMMEKYHKADKSGKRQYKEGEEFMYMGNKYKLHIGDFNKIAVSDTFNFPHFLLFRIEQEIHEWYIREARRFITMRVNHHADIMKATYKDIYFSDTISKWGSCSHDNSLQFNWRLVMAPILVIDYVIVHELVHTREKNHKDGFWRKVRLYKPAYKQYKKWLNENSRLLF